MSFLSKLIIDDIEYSVLNTKYAIKQKHDPTGLPGEKPIAGTFHVRIEAVKSTELFDWALDSKMTKNGTLVLYDRDKISAFRNFEFTQAYCLELEEEYHHDNNQPVYTEILIGFQKLKVRDSAYENDWPSKFDENA